MMDLMQVLLSAVQSLPNAAYVTKKLLEKQLMSVSQKVIAALYQITNKADFGFHVAYEPALIEEIIEAAELPFNGESYTEVKSRLFTPSMTPALNKIGVEITRKGDFVTVWGPGVHHA